MRRRKSRASFRTKKGISRRPLQKKNIKPVENKASQLRAKQHQDEDEAKAELKLKLDSKIDTGETTPFHEQQEKRHSLKSNEGRLMESGRFSSAGVKTPAPASENTETSMRTSHSNHSLKSIPSDPNSKSAPPKPQRTKATPVSTPAVGTPRINRKIPQTSWALHSSDDSYKKYAGKSEKTIPSNIPKPRVNVSNDPSKELVFISLDSASLPLPNEKPKIDEVRRKRRIQRPVSNIFDGTSNDLPAQEHMERRVTLDDADLKYSVHVNKTSSSSSCSKTSLPPSKPMTSLDSKSHKSASASSVPIPESCLKLAIRAKPRQVKALDTSSLKRQDSIESPCLSRRRLPIISPRLSESNSLYSENSDLDYSCSYDSLHDDSAFKVPESPTITSSPRFRSNSKSNCSLPPSSLISMNDLENQILNLRTPPKRSGSISVVNIKCRRSWIKSQSFPEDDVEV